jgi:hypothetical protein
MSRTASFTLAAVLGLASVAHAQDTETTSVSADASDVTPTQGNPDRTRFRGGFSIGGGVGFGFGTMPLFTAQGRLGAQINRMFAVFYQPTATLGVTATAGSAAAVVTSQNAIVGNVTLADVFEVGLGPSIDYVAMGAGSVGGAVVAGAGVAFGADARLAWIPGGANNAESGRRSGFAITLNVHPTFAGGTTLVPVTLGLGADWF